MCCSFISYERERTRTGIVVNNCDMIVSPTSKNIVSDPEFWEVETTSSVYCVDCHIPLALNSDDFSQVGKVDKAH